MTDIQVISKLSNDFIDSIVLPEGTRGQPIHAFSKPFYLVLENCKYTVSSNYGEKSYLSFELSNEALEIVKAIEDTVVKRAQRDARFSVLDNVKMTPKTWDKYWRPSVDSTNAVLKVTLKDTTQIFSNDKTPTSIGFMKMASTVNLLVTPTNFWCMNGRVGISWVVQQIRLLDTCKTDNSEKWEMEEDDDY